MVLLMMRRRIYQELPNFFGYTLFQVLRSILLLVIRAKGTPTAYAYSYWVAEGVSAVFGFLVINEVFTKLLGRYDGIRYVSRLLFRWTFVILVLLAFVAAISPPTEKTPGLIAAILSLERSVRIIQCGLLLFLFVSSSVLSISWRHSLFGIALGFGIFASVELIVVSTRIQAGGALNTAFVLLKPGSYFVTAVVWSIYLLLPARSTVLPELRRENFVSDWNTAILGMLRQ